MNDQKLPEPWLRGTLTDVQPVQRAVLHALQLAKEDLWRWCGQLTDEQINASPAGLPPVAFHLRHIARSIDRLLTYAEGGELQADQIGALKTESAAGATRFELLEELASAMERSSARIRRLDAVLLAEPRPVGMKRLPSTVAGLLVHVADHTQRHVGQAITTSKVVTATAREYQSS